MLLLLCVILINWDSKNEKWIFFTFSILKGCIFSELLVKILILFAIIGTHFCVHQWNILFKCGGYSKF